MWWRSSGCRNSAGGGLPRPAPASRTAARTSAACRGPPARTVRSSGPPAASGFRAASGRERAERRPRPRRPSHAATPSRSSWSTGRARGSAGWRRSRSAAVSRSPPALASAAPDARACATSARTVRPATRWLRPSSKGRVVKPRPACRASSAPPRRWSTPAIVLRPAHARGEAAVDPDRHRRDAPGGRAPGQRDPGPYHVRARPRSALARVQPRGSLRPADRPAPRALDHVRGASQRHRRPRARSLSRRSARPDRGARGDGRPPAVRRPVPAPGLPRSAPRRRRSSPTPSPAGRSAGASPRARGTARPHRPRSTHWARPACSKANGARALAATCTAAATVPRSRLAATSRREW